MSSRKALRVTKNQMKQNKQNRDIRRKANDEDEPSRSLTRQKNSADISYKKQQDNYREV
jgi:hypothetical protein